MINPATDVALASATPARVRALIETLVELMRSARKRRREKRRDCDHPVNMATNAAELCSIDGTMNASDPVGLLPAAGR
jgi:hypothetical protein